MTAPTRFDLHRESLALPPDVWEWLEHCADIQGRTRSEIATETLRAAMAAEETK